MFKKFLMFTFALLLAVGLYVYDEYYSVNAKVEAGGYSVYVDDEFLGNVESKKEFEEYIESEYVKLNEESTYGPVYYPTNYEIVSVVNAFDTPFSDEEVFKKFQKEVEFLVNGYKVSIDREAYNSDKDLDSELFNSDNSEEDYVHDLGFNTVANYEVVYTLNKEEVDQAFDKLLKTYINEEDVDSIKEENIIPEFNVGTNATIDFSVDGDVSGQEQLVPYNKVLVGDDLYNYFLFNDTLDNSNEYVVQDGDTLESIAYNNKMSVQELVASNPTLPSENTIISTGQKINVTSAKPVVNVFSTLVSVREEIIPFEVVIKEDATKLETDPEEVVQEGSSGLIEKTYQMEFVNGQITGDIVVINENKIKSPQEKVIVKGTKKIPKPVPNSRGRISYGRRSTVPYTGSNVDWGPVTVGGIRSSPFGYRRGEAHNGIDIAGLPQGSPILSTMDGYVMSTGQDPAGANIIVIDHENGVVTLYAHLHTIEVNPGDRVIKGQRIGGIGTTGRSTGVHLHFETYIDGVVQNPESLYNGFY